MHGCLSNTAAKIRGLRQSGLNYFLRCCFVHLIIRFLRLIVGRGMKKEVYGNSPQVIRTDDCDGFPYTSSRVKCNADYLLT